VCEGDPVDATPEVNPADATPPRETDLVRLTEAMRQFTRERDWEQFHDPKSLVLALTGEVGELAELVQWLPSGEAAALLAAPGRLHERVGEEISDVLLYLLRLADVVGLDLERAAVAKLASGRSRYPVRDVHGRAPRKD
jgi:NTP pyrophosphatase (non-canonical NTP hydrolase)